LPESKPLIHAIFGWLRKIAGLVGLFGRIRLGIRRSDLLRSSRGFRFSFRGLHGLVFRSSTTFVAASCGFMADHFSTSAFVASAL
jgi:hypothetical protein